MTRTMNVLSLIEASRNNGRIEDDKDEEAAESTLSFRSISHL